MLCPVCVQMIPVYDLYKHPVQLDMLAIVQYLHYIGHTDSRARLIVERNHPRDVVNSLPTIREVQTGTVHNGLDACVHFFERSVGGLMDLAASARDFKISHPHFRIGCLPCAIKNSHE